MNGLELWRVGGGTVFGFTARLRQPEYPGVVTKRILLGNIELYREP